MPRIVPMVGKRFGKLVVLEMAPVYKNGQCSWICQCDCGLVTEPIAGSNLRRGITKSCGCLAKERCATLGRAAKKHGMHGSRIYFIWQNMKARCHNPQNHHYPWYGARGIQVCEEWRDSFEAFHDWAMKNGYEEDLTIDRIDSKGNYCPENCRFVTRAEQNRNTSRTVLIEINGKKQTMSEWSRESGVPKGTINYRYKHGYTGDALIRPYKTKIIPKGVREDG